MADSHLQSKQVRLGEVDYAYSEGPANGPKLLLMHGVSGSRETWDPVLPYLVGEYHLFAVDHRGHGRTSHQTGTSIIWSMMSFGLSKPQ
jgi:pimeloyl-ACP methyl ester carboxylesterase